MQYHPIPHNAIRHNNTLCNTTQYHIMQYNTMPYDAIPHNTIQYQQMQCARHYPPIPNEIFLGMYIKYGGAVHTSALLSEAAVTVCSAHRCSQLYSWKLYIRYLSQYSIFVTQLLLLSNQYFLFPTFCHFQENKTLDSWPIFSTLPFFFFSNILKIIGSVIMFHFSNQSERYFRTKKKPSLILQ